MKYYSDLYHTGVLGMKWGHRKVTKLNAKISKEKAIGKKMIEEDREIGKFNKNYNVKKEVARSKQITDKNVKKMEAKRNKIQSKLDNQATKETQKAINNMPTGKAMAQAFLLGSYGSVVYTSLRTSGVSKGKAIIQAATNNWANELTFNQLSKAAKW